jgi:hypothetical protein
LTGLRREFQFSRQSIECGLIPHGRRHVDGTLKRPILVGNRVNWRITMRFIPDLGVWRRLCMRVAEKLKISGKYRTDYFIFIPRRNALSNFYQYRQVVYVDDMFSYAAFTLGCIAGCMQHAYDRMHPACDRKHAAYDGMQPAYDRMQAAFRRYLHP